MYTQIPYADLCNLPKFQFHCWFTPEFWLSAPWGSSEINLRPKFELFFTDNSLTEIWLAVRQDTTRTQCFLVRSKGNDNEVVETSKQLESIRVIVIIIWRCYLRDVLDDSGNISLSSRKKLTHMRHYYIKKLKLRN